MFSFSEMCSRISDPLTSRMACCCWSSRIFAPIHVQPLRIDALPREVAQQALYADLQLPLDQRIRELKLVVVFQPLEHLLPHLFLGVVALVLFEILANFRFKLFERLVLAKPLGEFVVDFRDLFGLDPFDLYRVPDGFPGETLVPGSPAR